MVSAHCLTDDRNRNICLSLCLVLRTSFFFIPAKPNAGLINIQGVKPNVHDVVLVSWDRHAPRHFAFQTRDTEILKSASHTDTDIVRSARQQDFLRWVKDEFGSSYLISNRDRLLGIGSGLNLTGTYSWELAALSTANPGTDFDTVTVNAGTATGNLDLSVFGDSEILHEFKNEPGIKRTFRIDTKLLAKIETKRRPTASASRRAIVVLPVPGGPQKISEPSELLSSIRVSAPSGPSS